MAGIKSLTEVEVTSSRERVSEEDKQGSLVLQENTNLPPITLCPSHPANETRKSDPTSSSINPRDPFGSCKQFNLTPAQLQLLATLIEENYIDSSHNFLLTFSSLHALSFMA